MSWLQIAASLIRGAMNSPRPQPQVRVDPQTEEEITGLTDLVNRHRTETDRRFDAVSQALQAQNQRYEQALRIQRRWNYGLLAGLIGAVIIVALFWRA
jgi:hypothetical protein